MNNTVLSVLIMLVIAVMIFGFVFYLKFEAFKERFESLGHKAVDDLDYSLGVSRSATRRAVDRFLDMYPMWEYTSTLPEDAIVLAPADGASKELMKNLIDLLPPGSDHATLLKEGCNMLQLVLIAAQKMTGEQLYIGYEVNGITYKLVFNSPFVKGDVNKSKS